MEIRAVLEALSMKEIEICISTMKYILFKKFMIITNKVNALLLVVVVLLESEQGYLSSDAWTETSRAWRKA